jgi:hypothetical protein
MTQAASTLSASSLTSLGTIRFASATQFDADTIVDFLSSWIYTVVADAGRTGSVAQ